VHVQESRKETAIAAKNSKPTKAEPSSSLEELCLWLHQKRTQLPHDGTKTKEGNRKGAAVNRQGGGEAKRFAASIGKRRKKHRGNRQEKAYGQFC